MVKGWFNRQSKYKAQITTVNGIRFHSKAESKRYLVLKSLYDAGQIKDLKLQVPFDIKVNNMKVCRYIADFTYIEGDKYIVEDVKGVKTPLYSLKKKLVKAVFDIDIRET